MKCKFCGKFTKNNTAFIVNGEITKVIGRCSTHEEVEIEDWEYENFT
jgi:hypothetical protein